MKALSMLKRLAALKRKEFVEPAGPVTLSEEWIEIKDFQLTFLEHRFPGAYLALLAGYDQVEEEDRRRGKPDGLKLRRTGKVPWLETEEGRMHALTCKLGWYGVLWNHHDACIAMAEEIRRIQES